MIDMTPQEAARVLRMAAGYIPITPLDNLRQDTVDQAMLMGAEALEVIAALSIKKEDTHEMF